MSRLILPIAPPAAGKSYTARMLVGNDLLHAEDVVEPDYYRWLLSGDRANQDVNKTVFQIVNSIVFTRLHYGFDVYLDATNINESHRTLLLDKIKNSNMNVQLIVLISNVDREILDERNSSRLYPVPQKVIKRMWDQSQKLQVKILRSNYGAKVYTLEDAQEWKEIP